MLHRIFTALGVGRLTARRAQMSGTGICIRAGGHVTPYAQQLRPLVRLLARQAAQKFAATRCNGEAE